MKSENQNVLKPPHECQTPSPCASESGLVCEPTVPLCWQTWNPNRKETGYKTLKMEGNAIQRFFEKFPQSKLKRGLSRKTKKRGSRVGETRRITLSAMMRVLFRFGSKFIVAGTKQGCSDGTKTGKWEKLVIC